MTSLDVPVQKYFLSVVPVGSHLKLAEPIMKAF